MIISHPILGPIKQDDFSFAALVKDTGTYPVLPSQMWHGGAHIAVDGTGGVQVRAIADGEVLAYRVPTEKPKDEKALEKHPLGYRGWSDDGFVLIKHQKESGANTPVVFYSLYMHLSKLAKRFKGAPGVVQTPAADDNLIKRKYQLGDLGSVYGKDHHMHFEIFTDEASLNSFFKRGKSDFLVDGQGRGEADIWGDVHFVIPKDTPYWTQYPETPDCPANKSTQSTLCVTIAYSRSAKLGKTENGNRLITTHNEGGAKIDQRSDPNFEYEIYKLAQKRFPQHISAGYELLRFGRVIGPDSLPADARNLQQIPLGFGRQGWVDLNRPEIKKLSDADFPYWHWKRITEEGGAFNPNDGKCEPAALLPLLDKNHDGLLAPLEFASFVRNEESRKRLSHAICKFPTEWDASDFEAHWGWLKAYFKNPAAREKELAQNHKTWLSTVQQRLAPLQANAEQQLKEVKDARQDILEDKDALDKCLQDNAKKKTDLEQKLKQQNEQLAKQKKNKVTKAEDIDKTTNAIFDTDGEIIAIQEQRAEIKQAIARIAERLETADQALIISEQTLANIKRDMQKIPGELNAADEEIKRADEDLKKNPPNPDSDKLWQEFKAHITALQFWDKVPGLPNVKQVWHFHPVAFVEHFRKCHWLSKEELEQIYPDSEGSNETGVLPLPQARERYRQEISKVMYKYGVTTRTKMTHFFGQGAVESFSLQIMVEPSNAPYRPASLAAETNGYYSDPRDFYYTHVQFYDRLHDNIDKEKLLDSKGNSVTISGSNEDKKKAATTIDRALSKAGDGQKFRGRGMKQLTGRYNYARYYVYRGWLRKDSFDSEWWPASPAKRPPIINDPQRIGTDSFNCIDAGGWFWEAGSSPNKFKSINSAITEEDVGDPAITRVTKSINGGTNGLSERIKQTQRIYKILGDS